MLTIILGVILSVIVLYIFIRFVPSGEDLATMLIALIMIGCCIVGLLTPVTGYSEWEYKERIELVSLNNSTIGFPRGIVNISVSSDSVYTYRHAIESEFGTDSSVEYILSTVPGSDAVEVEDPNIVSPYLIIYERRGKKSVWSFAIATEQEKYVFYVPPGTIGKDVALR